MLFYGTSKLRSESLSLEHDTNTNFRRYTHPSKIYRIITIGSSPPSASRNSTIDLRSPPTSHCHNSNPGSPPPPTTIPYTPHAAHCPCSLDCQSTNTSRGSSPHLRVPRSSHPRHSRLQPLGSQNKARGSGPLFRTHLLYKTHSYDDQSRIGETDD